MANEIHIEVQAPVFLDDWVRLSARVRGPRRWLSWQNDAVFFEVPSRTLDWLVIRGQADDRHDAFLRAMLWAAMEAHADLTIHGRVSAQLLKNLDRYQEIVCRWWPQYRPARLRADEEIAEPAAASPPSLGLARERAVLAFSGGLDSIESLVAHKKGWRGRNTLDIAACVFIHGFDIPLDDDDAYQGAFKRAQAIAGHYSTDLVAVRSNAKSLLPEWLTSFAGAISAVLSLFERRFATGLLAASSAYEATHGIATGLGSTPLIDPLLSSATFCMAHDLAVYRVEKTARLAHLPVVWKHLRVCWEGKDLSTNCGRCEKCLRQMLCMLACGITDFSAFSSPLTLAQVLAAPPPKSLTLENWKRCYAHAVERGLGRQEIFVAMKHLIDRAQPPGGAKTPRPWWRSLWGG